MPLGLYSAWLPMRMYGGDATLPIRWLTIKGEAAYFTSTSASTDEYMLYVVQLERQTGEWVFVGGVVPPDANNPTPDFRTFMVPR